MQYYTWRAVLYFLVYCNCCTHDDRLPLEVDVVDAHHLVGRKSSDRKIKSMYDVNLNNERNYIFPVSNI